MLESIVTIRHNVSKKKAIKDHPLRFQQSYKEHCEIPLTTKTKLYTTEFRPSEFFLIKSGSPSGNPSGSRLIPPIQFLRALCMPRSGRGDNIQFSEPL